MTDAQIAASLTEAELCPACEGEGGFPVCRERCCGGSDWECGANGCTGPIADYMLEQCELCGGSGFVRAILESRDAE